MSQLEKNASINSCPPPNADQIMANIIAGELEVDAIKRELPQVSPKVLPALREKDVPVLASPIAHG